MEQQQQQSIPAQQIKSNEELKEASEIKVKPKLNINDLVIPIILGIIFVVITIVVFVPMIESTIKNRADLKNVKEKQEQLIKLKEAVNSIDDGIMQVDLLNAKKVIPKSLTVSNFIYYIDELAKELDLTSKTLSAGDIHITAGGSENEKQIYSGVSGPLAYSGLRENVLNFLDSLYSASPYIISADDISLEQSSVSDEWRVTLNITGYYVPERSYRVDLYLPFSPYTNKADIVEIFRQKAEKLK
ncbi:MAG TPA: hypothetical protein PLD77_03235 [Candidatus Dojkabacteria bacterium]|nr:hypothetical protein [Candidatus Dojkabacteria bacterium]